MADSIITHTDDGQSIPSVLAATPASKKPRGKALKPATTQPATIPAVPGHPLAALVEAETVIEAEAPVFQQATAAGTASVGSPESAFASIATPPATPGPEASMPPSPAAEPAAPPITSSTPTAAVPAYPPKESIMATTIENMTTQTADTTAKAQAFLADAGERTKGAVAKGSKLFEDATAFGKGNVEAMMESSKIAARGIETMGQDVAEFGRKQFEEASAAFKTLATVKSPTEFMKLQGDFMRSAFDSMVAETSRSTETMLKLAGEVAQPISNRMAMAADKMKVAA